MQDAKATTKGVKDVNMYGLCYSYKQQQPIAGHALATDIYKLVHPSKRDDEEGSATVRDIDSVSGPECNREAVMILTRKMHAERTFIPCLLICWLLVLLRIATETTVSHMSTSYSVYYALHLHPLIRSTHCTHLFAYLALNPSTKPYPPTPPVNTISCSCTDTLKSISSSSPRGSIGTLLSLRLIAGDGLMPCRVK
jgi:hypothetical protein